MPGSEKKKYDLIFSLGGSCASAIQLSFKGLRLSSLPFDWLWHQSDRHFDALSYAFEHGFDEWLQEKNLVELVGDERGNSSYQQYKDTFTDFCHIHDFKDEIAANPAICGAVQKRYKRRFKRLLRLLSRAKSTLLVVDTQREVDLDKVVLLLDILARQFPKNHFDITIQFFNSGPRAERIVHLKPNIRVNYIERRKDNSDFSIANEDWNFLYDVSITFWGKQILQRQLLKSIFHIGASKKTLFIYFFKGFLPCILMFRLYLICVQLDLSVGRPRD